MKNVAVLLAEGFEEIEALTVVDVLRRAKINCDLISIDKEKVVGAHNIVVEADKLINDDIDNYDMLVFPGGLLGAENLSKNLKVIETIRKFDKLQDKFIAAICASPAMVLTAAGIEEDRYITSYPGDEFENLLKKSNYVDELVVVDGNLITSRGPATSLLFAYKIVDVLGGDSNSLKKGMLWDRLEDEK